MITVPRHPPMGTRKLRAGRRAFADRCRLGRFERFFFFFFFFFLNERKSFPIEYLAAFEGLFVSSVGRRRRRRRIEFAIAYYRFILFE